MAAAHETLVVELVPWQRVAKNLTEHICARLNDAAAVAGLHEALAAAVASNALRDLVLALLRQMDAVLAKVATAEADERAAEEDGSLYSLLYSLVRHAEESDVALLVPEICQQLTSADGTEQLRMNALTKLYGVLKPDSPQRLEVFRSIIGYADRTKQYEVLQADVKTLEKLCAQWNVAPSEQQALLLALSEALSHAGEARADDAQSVLLSFLATFKVGDDLGAVAKQAVQGAVGAIRRPLTSRHFAVLDLAPVDHLQNVKAHAPLFELLKIFCTGTLPDYAAFYAKNPKACTASGLTHAENEENMRLLTLSSLAAENESVSYVAVAKALQVEVGAVEEWVVKGITSKLIDAKMDQLHSTIVINRGSQRVFNQEQWAQLGKKLHSWRSSVRNLLQTVQAAQSDRAKTVTQVRG